MDRRKRASTENAAALFGALETKLASEVEGRYFAHPNEFTSLLAVLDIVGDNSEELLEAGDSIKHKLQQTEMYQALVQQQHMVAATIEEVVKKQEGGMNNAVDTMGSVIQTYTGSRDEVQVLRKSLLEINEILSPRGSMSSMSRKKGAASLRELWAKKVQHETYLGFLDELEAMKNAPATLARLVDQKRYLGAVHTLNTALASMFSPSLVHVGALSDVRENLLDQKAKLLEYIVASLNAECFGSMLSSLEGGTNAADVDVENVTYPWRNDGSSSSLQWHMDDVTVEAEAALFDPSKAGPFFIRLLVQASRELGCGEDVARMLLESSKGVFRDVVLKLKAHLMAQRYASSTAIFKDYVVLLLSQGYSALHNLFYILRLLYVNGAVSAGGGGIKDKLPAATEKAVMDVWTDIGGIILSDMQRHLMGSTEVDMDAEDSLLTRVSTSSVATTKNREGMEDVVCTPEPLLVTHAYIDAMEFSEAVEALFKDQAHCSVNKKLYNFRMVLDAMSRIVTDEVIPSIQSDANRQISELMVNPKFFLVEGAADESLQGAAGAEGANKSVVMGPDAQNICPGAVRVARTASTLLLYWRMLPQHKDHTSTILDRLISGYVTAAREELGNLTWKMKSATEEAVNTGLRGRLMLDPFFVAYRNKTWSALGKDATIAEAKAIVFATTEEEGNDVVDFWKACGALSSQQTWVAGDASVLGSVAAITESCSWLAGRLTEFAQLGGHGPCSEIAGGEHVQLVVQDMVREYSRQLHKLALCGLILLRGELQIACIQTLAPNKNLNLMGKDADIPAAGGKDGKEGIVADLNKRLQRYQEAITDAASAETLTVVLSPLCSLVPRLVKMHLTGSERPTGDAATMVKARLLRCIDGFEQTLSVMLDDSTDSRQLYFHLTAEFSRTRKAAVSALAN